MRRSLLFVCALSGCDLVIPLTEPEPIACGPYETIQPVLFADGLMDPSDFSIAYDGTHGMVRAKVQLTATTTYTGPVPIVLDADGVTWKLDRLANMNMLKLTGGHMLGDGTMFGWRDRSVQEGPPRLDRFAFTANAWNQVTTEDLDNDSSKNYRPGNEIVLPIDFGTLRFFVEIKSDYDGALRNTIVIRQRRDNDPWVSTGQAEKIASFAQLDPLAAVMTAAHDKLVYAAKDRGSPARIYATFRNREEDKYELGRKVDINSIDGVDDTEPWIAETCDVLYFRRNGITYRAQ